MIVKKISSKGEGGSFKGLAKYITDKRHDGEKVLDYYCTNCSFENMELNVDEITFNQEANNSKNAKSDKTFHFIVSFQEGEKPNLAIIKEIEKELLSSINMQSHQRLSAIHDNTDYLHLHIAVSKVCPETGKIVNPYYNALKLQKKAIELEERFNLKPTNHVKNENNQKEEIATIEVHTGVKSFNSWIMQEVKTEVLDVLNNPSATFKDLQKTLNKHNLELRERGAGLVISDKDRKLFVRASDIDRSLSKASLKKRFGEPNFNEKPNEPITSRYEKPSNELFKSYLQERKNKEELKARAFEDLRGQKDKRFSDLKSYYAIRRDKIKKNVSLSSAAKKEAYRLLYLENLKSNKLAKKSFGEKKHTIYEEFKKQTYKEYTQAKTQKEESGGSLGNNAEHILQKEKDVRRRAIGDNLKTASRIIELIKRTIDGFKRFSRGTNGSEQSFKRNIRSIGATERESKFAGLNRDAIIKERTDRDKAGLDANTNTHANPAERAGDIRKNDGASNANSIRQTVKPKNESLSR